jgi:hypothetical protein
VDAVLYAHALAGFAERARRATAETGVTLLC